MGMAWGPGRYDKSALQQGTQGASGPGGSSCDCKKTCCIATNEVHYQVKASSGNSPIDGQGGTNPSLSGRAAMEFYNAGTVIFEVSNKPFVYGDGNGRPVLAGASYSLQVGPSNTTAGTTHYIQGASDPFDCRITELGV